MRCLLAFRGKGSAPVSHNTAGYGDFSRLSACSLALAAALLAIFPHTALAKRSSSSNYTQIIRQPDDKDPLTIVISLGKQRLQVFDSKGVVAQSRISSGSRGRETPTGIFTILQKNKRHFSNLYDDAPMPNMQRITWSGVALHAGHLPGYPASHGCIRLPYGFSRSLFSMTKLGTRVIVHDDLLEPEAIENAHLFAGLPPGQANIPHPVRRSVALKAQTQAATAGSVSAMLGVTPAAAAEAAIKVASNAETAFNPSVNQVGQKALVIRTRALAFAERQEDVDTKAASVTAREEIHGEAAAALAEINGRLKAARMDLRASQKAKPGLDREVKRNEANLKKAKQRLAKFVTNQKREVKRAAERARTRQRSYLSDAKNTEMDSQTWSTRNEARKAEAKRDAGARKAAVARESELEAAYLNAIHDLETSEQFARAQVQIIALREATIKAVLAERVSMQKVYNGTREALDKARVEYDHAVAAVQHFSKPATVFISRKTNELRIRQGHTDVFSTPVAFAYPHARIGTHVFTAVGYKEKSESSLQWQVLTVTNTNAIRPDPKRPSRLSQDVVNELLEAPAPTADNALERIDIPQEARVRINELMKPGSTLIISDDRASPETGKYTDFIVQPQT